jgi:GTP-binding protein
VLAGKPEILCLNKCDALTAEDIAEKTKALIKAAKLKKGRAKNAPSPVLAISGAAKIGITDLLRRAYAVIQETRAKEAERKSSTIEAAQ